jgi:hypothetical protein
MVLLRNNGWIYANDRGECANLCLSFFNINNEIIVEVAQAAD